MYIKYINKRSKAVDNKLVKWRKKLHKSVSDKQYDHHILAVRIIPNQDDKLLFLIVHYKKDFNVIIFLINTFPFENMNSLMKSFKDRPGVGLSILSSLPELPVTGRQAGLMVCLDL